MGPTMEARDADRRHSSRRETDNITAHIVASITDELVAFDRQWRFSYVNEAALRSMCRETGRNLRLHDVLGQNVWAMFPQLVGTVTHETFHEAMRQQKTMAFETHSDATDRWIKATVYPSEGGLAVYSQDVTERKRLEERLAYDAYLLDNVHDAVIATDERLLVTMWSRGAQQLYGWTAEEALGRHVWDVVPTDLTEEQRAHALTELQTSGRFQVDALTYSKDGAPVHVDGITIALRDERSAITGYINIRRDITERRLAEEARLQAEEKLRISEAYLAEGQRLTHTGSWAWNVSTGDLFWSDEHYRICGLDPEDERPSSTSMQWIHPDDRDFVQQTFEKALRDRADFDLDFRVVWADGTIRYVHSFGHPVVNADGQLTEYVGTILDTTERKQAEDARRELTRLLVGAQENERGRISRELHDDLGQLVSVIGLRLAMLKREQGDTDNLDSAIATLQQLVAELDSKVDLIAWQLRPAALTHLGLDVALTNYLDEWSEHVRVQASMAVSGQPAEHLSDDSAIAIYRIAQEVLNNVAKHADAEQVSVVLQGWPDHVALIVEDDGVGFDPEDIILSGEKRLGLVGMQERASLVGGSFQIESEQGIGTTVIVRIPTTNPSEAAN